MIRQKVRLKLSKKDSQDCQILQAQIFNILSITLMCQIVVFLVLFIRQQSTHMQQIVVIMQTSNQLKGAPLLQVNPIQRRANSKIVKVGNRSFLVGGMTAESISNSIYQFRLNYQYTPSKLEWKQVNFENQLFSPRNSFSACGSKTHIYIWGGLQFYGTQQRALSDLIQIEIDTGKMKNLPLKNKIKIHSASLIYNEQNNQLIGYGGSDEDTKMPAYLFKLKLDQAEEYEWEQISINNSAHQSYNQGFVWQHSSNISSHSLFNDQQGKFLTIVGGCRFPHAPYNSIVEINLQTNQVTNSTILETSLVSHDSVLRQKTLYIFGGSNGGDFNSSIYVLQKGQIYKLKGHRAIGCCCGLLQNRKMLVYGGVCGQTSINGAFIYQ